MGPIILFDKSTLQSLSVNESVWFDQFFLSNISPLFYVETLADLEKALKSGRTPEQEVGLIAAKTPENHGRPNMFHTHLFLSNLQGYPVTMDGRPVIGGGKAVKASGRTGFVFDEPTRIKSFFKMAGR